MVDETQNVLGTVLQSLPGEPEGVYVYVTAIVWFRSLKSCVFAEKKAQDTDRYLCRSSSI